MELLARVSEQHLVVNRVEPSLMRRLRTTIDDAMDTAGLPLLGVVPEDPTVSVAASEGVPVVLKGAKPAARAYLNIAKRLLGRKVPVLTR
jgi:septum site-determining protein MinD